MIGYSRNDMVGMNYRNFTDADNGDKLHTAFEWAYNTGKSESIFDLKMIKDDGKILYVEMSVTPIKDSEGNAMGFRGIIRDVSVRREYQEKLEYLVYHDELTGLYNRKAFFEKLKDVVGQSDRDRKEKHVLFMDLDKFKQVNDTLGHETGDWLLIEVAKRLKTALRQTDYICRLGGDEFTVVLNNINEPAPEKAAQRIIDMLSQPYNLNGNIIDFIKISIGIAEYPSDARDISTLVNYADTAMFEAKKVGNCYIFYRDISGNPSVLVPMLYVVK
jgi:diguanylate cyclase (GGDEF)-like protein/PAS domain S-box-containing protein